MRAAKCCGAVDWHRTVAAIAFDRDAFMSLESDVSNIVIRMQAWEFSVRRPVAGRTLDSTMTDGEAVK